MSPGEGPLGGRPPTHRPRHLRQSQGGEGGGGTGQAGWTGQLRLPTLEGPGTACVCLPWSPPFCSVAKPLIWRKTSGRTDSRWAPLGQMSPKMLIAVNVLNENTSYTAGRRWQRRLRGKRALGSEANIPLSVRGRRPHSLTHSAGAP